ncbi:MAG: hypothetical protein ABJX32_18075 [Tateyamaria sp.]|uniref:hypothetical protein n=1 Tax=Tateyamaria sp. TaxID=1929288 RepID=UPI00329F7378
MKRRTVLATSAAAAAVAGLPIRAGSSIEERSGLHLTAKFPRLNVTKTGQQLVPLWDIKYLTTGTAQVLAGAGPRPSGAPNFEERENKCDDLALTVMCELLPIEVAARGSGGRISQRLPDHSDSERARHLHQVLVKSGV